MSVHTNSRIRLNHSSFNRSLIDQHTGYVNYLAVISNSMLSILVENQKINPY